MSHDIQEPPLHLDDTSPNRPIVDDGMPAWRRATGLVSLLMAALLTLGATLLLLLPRQQVVVPEPEATVSSVTQQPTFTPLPTDTPLQNDSPVVEQSVLPTVSAETIQTILNAPSVAVADTGSLRVIRDNYNPFTLIPDRPRTEVIEYEIVEGDTIFSIAERYSLKPESIAWSNDRSIIQNLRPGRMLKILPVDGVYHTVIGSRTLGEIAASYGITDPYLVIDSEYNNLFGVTPETVLPSGEQVVIPGGEAEEISWNPTVEREGGDVSTSGGSFVSFAPGEAGSCGRVQNTGGSFWSPPMSSYSFVQGFSSFHTGVDLSASVGTPVRAANGGVVIFAGWNSYGYGSTIVVSHGPFSTLYGHLSQINVGCGQLVNSGQVIGGVGSSGNSSGPHLHFEIRYLDQPQNPTATIPF